jgi:hypothetical protein
MLEAFENGMGFLQVSEMKPDYNDSENTDHHYRSDVKDQGDSSFFFRFILSHCWV